MQLTAGVLRRRTTAGLIAAASGIAAVVLLNFPAASAVARGLSPGSPVPGSAIGRLQAIADNFAKINGDSSPVSISAVTTTHAKALTSATPGDRVSYQVGAMVYLITLTGNFKGYGASVPPGAAIPTGRYLSVVIDARTFSVLDWGLSPNKPPVSPAQLGPVTLIKV
jgi:hypothetical protein